VTPRGKITAEKENWLQVPCAAARYIRNNRPRFLEPVCSNKWP